MLFFKSSTGGNDFIIVEDEAFNDYGSDPVNFSRMICNRNLGAGADGVIFYKKRMNGIIDFSIYNRDGSRAELSGNGMSGLGALMFFQNSNLRNIRLMTDAGEREINLLKKEDIHFRLKVEIGSPDFKNENHFPFIENEKLKYRVSGIEFYPVSVGNPHAVVMLNEQSSQAELERTGKKLESHEIFPQKTNVEFINIKKDLKSDKLFNPLFFERGVGFTKTSSTGSAAIFAVLRRLKITEDELKIKTASGISILSWHNSIFIENSTEIVYKGTFLKNEKKL